jgi:hypothetical protein
MRFHALVLAAAVLAGATLSAAPAWKAELTSPATGAHPRLQPTTLEFQMSWKGMINSGTLKMDFQPADARKPGAYVVRSSAQSQGVAARLFPYRSQFWSDLHPDTYRPRFFQASVDDAKKEATTTVRHFADRVESRETSVSKRTRLTETSDETFRFSPVFDIFSAMLHVRSQTLAPDERISIVIHPFDNPYLLRVHCQGRVIHNGRPALKLSVGMQKIDRNTLELKPYKKLKRDATLWLSDDADRIPLEFRAAVFIGDVRATLVQQHR